MTTKEERFAQQLRDACNLIDWRMVGNEVLDDITEALLVLTTATDYEALRREGLRRARLHLVPTVNVPDIGNACRP